MVASVDVMKLLNKKDLRASILRVSDTEEGMPLIWKTVSEIKFKNDEYPDQTDATNAKVTLNFLKPRLNTLFFK